MEWSKTVGLALAALSLSVGLMGPAAAQKDAATGPAWVDLPRVLTEYKKTPAYAKHGQKLREMARQAQSEMQMLAQLRYCSDQERAEALALKNKKTLSAAEQARLDTLLKKADQVDNEASGLAQKQKPTDADTKRLADISKMRTDAAKNLAKEEADRRDKLRNLEMELTEAIENELLELVQKVAKDRKLEVIYERRAVLVGGVDLTDQVIKKLPK